MLALQKRVQIGPETFENFIEKIGAYTGRQVKRFLQNLIHTHNHAPMNLAMRCTAISNCSMAVA